MQKQGNWARRGAFVLLLVFLGTTSAPAEASWLRFLFKRSPKTAKVNPLRRSAVGHYEPRRPHALVPSGTGFRTTMSRARGAVPPKPLPREAQGWVQRRLDVDPRTLSAPYSTKQPSIRLGASGGVRPPSGGPSRMRARFNTKADPSERLQEFNRRVFPPDDGFAGTPARVTLKPGTVIDRFGSPSGTFASPVGTPKGRRALPPSTGPRPYSQYVVRKPIDAKAGPAARNFGQPGGGIQYEFGRTPNGFQSSLEYLKDNGYLRHATAKDRGFARGNFQAQAQ